MVDDYLAFDGWFAAGAKAEVIIDWVIPNHADYQVFAIIDPNNEVIEFDESDNQAQGPAANLIFRNGFEAP